MTGSHPFPSVNPINQLETIEMRDGSIFIGSSIVRFLFILFLSDRILSFSQSVILLPLAKAATLTASLLLRRREASPKNKAPPLPPLPPPERSGEEEGVG